MWDFPGGPGAKDSVLPTQGAQVRSLVWESDPQAALRPGTAKEMKFFKKE